MLIGWLEKDAPPLGSELVVPPPRPFPRCDASRGENAAQLRCVVGEGFLGGGTLCENEVTDLRWWLGTETASRYQEAGIPHLWAK